MGGLVLRYLGRVPKRNEVMEIDGTRFQVLRADSRRLYTLLVNRPTPKSGVESPDCLNVPGAALRWQCWPGTRDCYFRALWAVLAGAGVLALLFLLWSGAATPGRAAADGFAFGLAFFLGGVSWIYVSLSVFGGMPIWLTAPATLLFCAAMGLYPALCGWAYRRWRPAGAIGQALAFAALIALTDWLRGWLGTGFPWLAGGYSQVPPSPWRATLPCWASMA